MCVKLQASNPEDTERSKNMKKKVLITGVTGTMGFATLKQFAAHLDEFEIGRAHV